MILTSNSLNLLVVLKVLELVQMCRVLFNICCSCFGLDECEDGTIDENCPLIDKSEAEKGNELLEESENDSIHSSDSSFDTIDDQKDLTDDFLLLSLDEL